MPGDGVLEQVARAGRRATSPKRSESRIATGRAPIANTSRRMPPTPVAAPWNGSTALGWLCDSTLNAQASPSRGRPRPRSRPARARACRPRSGASEQPARVLVAAVLGPHEAEHGELDLVRLAAHLLHDQLVFGVGEPELAMALDDGHAGAPDNRLSPSTDPVSASTACSGCGISPSTFPAGLETPAMSRAEPLKLCPAA